MCRHFQDVGVLSRQLLRQRYFQAIVESQHLKRLRLPQKKNMRQTQYTCRFSRLQVRNRDRPPLRIPEDHNKEVIVILRVPQVIALC